MSLHSQLSLHVDNPPSQWMEIAFSLFYVRGFRLSHNANLNCAMHFAMSQRDVYIMIKQAREMSRETKRKAKMLRSLPPNSIYSIYKRCGQLLGDNVPVQWSDIHFLILSGWRSKLWGNQRGSTVHLNWAANCFRRNKLQIGLEDKRNFTHGQVARESKQVTSLSSTCFRAISWSALSPKIFKQNHTRQPQASIPYENFHVPSEGVALSININ